MNNSNRPHRIQTSVFAIPQRSWRLGHFSHCASSLKVSMSIARSIFNQLRRFSCPVTSSRVSPQGELSSYKRKYATANDPAVDRSAMNSVYRKGLTLPAISLYSKEGQRLLDEARAAGTAAGFLEIATNLVTQQNLTYCGLSSLTTVLNALCIDPQRVWKGPWRWYDETMLVNDEELLRQANVKGLSFQNIVDLLPKDKVKLEAFFATDSSLSEFRRRVLECCSTDSAYALVGYSRPALGQSGAGHYSPIGGYHDASANVLIMDVARFKYPPHWVPCTNLWEAMSVVNKVTGKSRGFMVISKP